MRSSSNVPKYEMKSIMSIELLDLTIHTFCKVTFLFVFELWVSKIKLKLHGSVGPPSVWLPFRILILLNDNKKLHDDYFWQSFKRKRRQERKHFTSLFLNRNFMPCVLGWGIKSQLKVYYTRQKFKKIWSIFTRKLALITFTRWILY